jgi:IMP dehydrogenase/GMP reductase
MEGEEGSALDQLADRLSSNDRIGARLIIQKMVKREVQRMYEKGEVGQFIKQTVDNTLKAQMKELEKLINSSFGAVGEKVKKPLAEDVKKQLAALVKKSG